MLSDSDSIIGLTFIVGHLATILTSMNKKTLNDMTPQVQGTPTNLLAMSVQGELDRFRESVNSDIDQSIIIQLVYWHTRLLILRLHPSTKAQDLIVPTRRIAIMLSASGSTSILHHHFVLLSALTLIELQQMSDTAAEALYGFEDLEKALKLMKSSRCNFINRNNKRDEGWQDAVTALISHRKKLKSSSDQNLNLGLQHLADVAIGKSTTDTFVDMPNSSLMESGSSATVSAAAAAASAIVIDHKNCNYNMVSLLYKGYLKYFRFKTI